MEHASLVFLHVALGVVWGGGVITAGLFIIPSVLEAGPGGGAVMAGVLKRKFPQVMIASAAVVVLTGIRLFMIRFSADWVTSPEGLVLSLGALLGIAGFIIGVFVQKPAADRLAALGAQAAQSDGPPSPELAAQLEATRNKLGKVARVNAFHLIAAMTLMASHRLAAMF